MPSSPLPDFANVIREETHEELWRLVFAITHSGPPTCYAVDVFHKSFSKGRITISRENISQDDAVRILRERALKWILDLESRPHTGDTSWGDL